MIETRIPPTTGRVARATICPKLTIMSIPGSVTGVTIRRRALINTICMAITTSHIFMLACQRETRVIVVEANITPTAGHMAGAAIRAKLAIVSISGSMAGKTVRRRTFELSIGMAGCAGCILVLASQWETRCAVVKARLLPATGHMTGTAIRAKLAIVSIPGGMAGIAIRRCALELSVGMAGGAGNILVLAPQRESGRAMVKTHILPTASHVAGTTICAELAVMGVVGSMAGETVRWRTFELSIGMAGCAGDILVLAPQRESCCAMIEIHIVPTTRVVTTRAILVKLAVMRVVLLVAGKTIFGRTTIAIRMALFTLNIYVLAGQLKIGEGVIKDPIVPIRRIMAGGTIHSKATFVRVIFLVTGKTLCGGSFE